MLIYQHAKQKKHYLNVVLPIRNDYELYDIAITENATPL